MAFKPMDEREFIRLIKIVGWSLKKSGFDYNLLNENGNYMCTIKITHGKNTKGERYQLTTLKRLKRCSNKRD